MVVLFDFEMAGMNKLEAEVFRGNDKRLMKFHVGFLIFYLLIATLVFFVFKVSLKVFYLVGFPVLLHLFLAYGSYKRSELSRKISVVVFVLLAITTIPIGTVLAIFVFLPATQWESPQDD